jgi:pentatricopeptide repeat protein
MKLVDVVVLCLQWIGCAIAFSSTSSNFRYPYDDISLRGTSVAFPSSRSSSLRQRNSQTHENKKHINIQNYATELHELSKVRTKTAAEKANKILNYMCSNAESELNVVHFASVINCWANVGDSAMAESILHKMIDDDIEGISITPNSHCFSGTLKAIINSQGDSISTRCEEWINTMRTLYERNKTDDLRPSVIIYNNLIQAYAEEIAIEKRHKRQTKTLFPNAPSSVDTMMDTKCKDFIEKAISLIQNMERSDRNGEFPRPDNFTYCSMCNLLAKVGNSEAAILSESYLRKVDGYDTPTWNAAISAWTSLCTIDGARRANELLNELEQSLNDAHGADDLTQGPNSLTYHTVISGWTRASLIGDSDYAATKAEHILHQMITNLKSKVPNAEYRFSPNVIAFSSIIDCWSKSSVNNSWQKALDVFNLMDEVNVKPNVITFTSVITACARSNSLEGAIKASELLQRMKEMHLTTGLDDMKPNAVTYFATIDSWARSKTDDAGVKAHELLSEMECLYRKTGDKSMIPDAKIYARVISAYANSNLEDSDKKAIQLLHKMEQFTLTGDEKYALAKPNIVLYNTLINSFARKGMSKKALAILNQMDQFNSKISNDADKVNPDEQCLSSIIYALSMSNMNGKARKALKILERLERSHIDGNWRARPSARTYNMVMNCCSNTSRNNKNDVAEALTIVFDVYARLRSCSYAEVDRFTYISLLKTCGKLIPNRSNEKIGIIAGVFQDCCEEGFVDDDIMKNLVAAVPKEGLDCILDKSVLSGELPHLWTRHVKI